MCTSCFQGLIEGVESFSAEKLKSVKTKEPASGKDGEFLKSVTNI